MSKSKVGKCARIARISKLGKEQPWFKVRRKRNRVRNKMAKASRKINRGR